MLKASKEVREAIEKTKEVMPDYWQKTVEQRSKGGAGSIVYDTIKQKDIEPTTLERLLINADWVPYTHPDIMEGCKAYKAYIPGHVGIINLDKLYPGAEVTLDDRKGTGKVSAVVTHNWFCGNPHPAPYSSCGPRNPGDCGDDWGCRSVKISKPHVDFTVIIIGEHEGNEVVFTFHPGDPVSPSEVPAEPGMHGKTITAWEALKMGLSTGKVE